MSLNLSFNFEELIKSRVMYKYINTSLEIRILFMIQLNKYKLKNNYIAVKL